VWSKLVEGAGPIGLRYIEPAADLRGHISSYYLFWADFPQVADMMRADLPQIRFMIAGGGQYSLATGSQIVTPRIALIGPTLGATRFAVTGPLLVFGIALLPAGWAALVRDDASRHADSVIDASAVFGVLMEDALSAMYGAVSPEILVSIADSAMRALVVRASEVPIWFTRLTDRWLVGAASPDVDTLVASAGMSSRQIERLARRIYGAPPKLLARKYRALRMASLLGQGHQPWQEVVGDAFYDQSHFIREFKHFTGQTPRHFQRDPTPVTRLSIGRRALAGQLPELALVS
jgi:AraC-like DNA-binding protein